MSKHHPTRLTCTPIELKIFVKCVLDTKTYHYIHFEGEDHCFQTVKFFWSHSSSKLLSKSYHAYGQCLNSNASHSQMGTSNHSAGLLVQKVVSFHMNDVSCWIVCTGSLYNFQSLEPSFLLRKAERVSMVSFRFLGGPLYRFSRHTINRLAVHKINSAGNYY